MNYRITVIAVVLSLCAGITRLNAQLDNDNLKYKLAIDSLDNGNLYFGLNTLNFFRNTEYFGSIEKGKTYFGYLLNPKLTYYPTSNVRIDFGGMFRKDFGADKFPISAPTFSIKYEKNGFAAVFGNYEGAMNHGFIEPLFNIENAVNKPLENGLQFKVNRKRVQSDTWIDWQRMIYYDSPFKEEISGGTSNMFTVYGAEKQFKISIPFQGVVHHFGGQIDTLNSTPLSTEFNFAYGLRLSYEFVDSSFFKEIRSDNYFVTFSDQSHVKVLPYSSGEGVYLNLLLRTKLLNVMMSYWEGNQFISPNGTFIYQSSNSFQPGSVLAVERYRSLFFVRLIYEKELARNLLFNFRFEPFYTS